MRDFNYIMTDYLALKHPHSRDASIIFDEIPHIYTINGSTDNVSVTTWCHSHFEPFNAEKIIQRMMSKPNWSNNKYFGKTAAEISAGWKEQGKIAACEGTNMHKMIEDYYQLGEFKEPITCSDAEINMFKAFVNKNEHLKPYRAEWMIWDDELRLAGSIDMVFQKPNGDLVIYDWKRCKNINKAPFNNLFSKTPCISHIPDSNYWHYSLQLNTYKGILERNYGIKISSMALVQLHPMQSNYKIISVPDLSHEIAELFEERLSQLDRLK